MNKRRKLALLVIEGDRNYQKANNVIWVNQQAFHVIEKFMFFLPKIDLDGSSKLTIFFKKRKIQSSNICRIIFRECRGTMLMRMR